MYLADSGPRVVHAFAFDGEREISLRHDAVAEVRLVVDGPRVLAAAALLRQTASEGRLIGPGRVSAR